MDILFIFATIHLLITDRGQKYHNF